MKLLNGFIALLITLTIVFCFVSTSEAYQSNEENNIATEVTDDEVSEDATEDKEPEYDSYILWEKYYQRLEAIQIGTISIPAYVNALGKKYFNEDDYPLFGLDPKALWTGAGAWCERKLRDIIRLYNMDYKKALKIASKKIAMIELFPYHSASFRLPSKVELDKIPSVQKLKEFVKGYVVEKAKREDAVLIATRSLKLWFSDDELEEYAACNNIVIYPPNLARSASLSEGSGGYKAIEKYLLNLLKRS